jgi:beta-phosphoglucomutase-like phosphatase (HAD superfamily)
MSRTTLAAVVFDMDGLMLDTECIYKEVWQSATAQVGYSMTDELYFTLVGRPHADCEAAVVAHFGNDFPLARAQVCFTETWQRHVATHGIQTKTGLLELFAFLDAKRLPTAVATSTDHDTAMASLRAAGITRAFDAIVTGDQIRHGKPAPDIYLEAAQRLQVAPEQCIAIEDSDAGTLAASSAGMRTLVVPDLKPPSAAARARAFRVVRDLHEAREVLAEAMQQPA